MKLKRWDLSGKIALITGSSRGIGRALALGLAECGADIMLHGHRVESIPDELSAEIRAMGVRCGQSGGDLSTAEGARELFYATLKQLGAPDILILNASFQVRKRWEMVTLEECNCQIQVDLLSALQLIQLGVPYMKSRHWGRIVTIGSVQQVKPNPQLMVYGAAKSALVNLVRNLALQLASDGITVNNLAPGTISTDRNREVLADSEFREKCIAKIPIGYIANPTDCVPPVLMFCAPESRYLTGCDLPVDGGSSI